MLIYPNSLPVVSRIEENASDRFVSQWRCLASVVMFVYLCEKHVKCSIHPNKEVAPGTQDDDPDALADSYTKTGSGAQPQNDAVVRINQSRADSSHNASSVFVFFLC